MSCSFFSTLTRRLMLIAKESLLLLFSLPSLLLSHRPTTVGTEAILVPAGMNRGGRRGAPPSLFFLRVRPKKQAHVRFQASAEGGRRPPRRETPFTLRRRRREKRHRVGVFTFLCEGDVKKQLHLRSTRGPLLCIS